MKNSNIPWLGEIPDDWVQCKLLYALDMPITDGPHETPTLYETGIPFISAEAIKNNKIDFNLMRGYISQEFYDLCCKKYIPQVNDIYMIKSGATTGNIAKVEKNDIFQIWSPLAVLRAGQNMYSQFLFYLLQSDIIQKQIQLKWSFGTQQNIGMRILESLQISFPPLLTQKAIVDFLDKKCAEIDITIEKTKTTIEKYKKLKQSIITEAVTKGLKQDVPMRDSGIEWIGEIPEGWDVNRLKFYVDILRGGSPRPIEEYITEKDGYNWIKIGDTLKGSRYITKVRQKIKYSGLSKTRYVEKNTLLLTNSMSFGEAYILKTDGCIHDGWLAFSGYTKIIKEYLYYYLISELSLNQFNTSVDGGVVQNLNIQKVRNAIIPLPPLKEQQEIVDFLDKKAATIDDIITKKEALLEKLTGYKKSLIYEAVTGKVEV